MSTNYNQVMIMSLFMIFEFVILVHSIFDYITYVILVVCICVGVGPAFDDSLHIKRAM